jgi:hypothetical protein
MTSHVTSYEHRAVHEPATNPSRPLASQRESNSTCCMARLAFLDKASPQDATESTAERPAARRLDRGIHASKMLVEDMGSQCGREEMLMGDHAVRTICQPRERDCSASAQNTACADQVGEQSRTLLPSLRREEMLRISHRLRDQVIAEFGAVMSTIHQLPALSRI